MASNPTIVNTTFSESPQVGINVAAQSFLTLVNSIVWGAGQEPIRVLNSPDPSVTFSDIQGSWPGTGNIDADPLFVQPGTNDLRLSYGSPCVDAGSNAALGALG